MTEFRSQPLVYAREVPFFSSTHPDLPFRGASDGHDQVCDPSSERRHSSLFTEKGRTEGGREGSSSAYNCFTHPLLPRPAPRNSGAPGFYITHVYFFQRGWGALHVFLPSPSVSVVPCNSGALTGHDQVSNSETRHFCLQGRRGSFFCPPSPSGAPRNSGAPVCFFQHLVYDGRVTFCFPFLYGASLVPYQ